MAWILDVDTTVKPLYGRQEGAVVGYNPKKPRRPSHCYHTYSMAGTRLVFDVPAFASSIMATPDMICPDVQKPHWKPSRSMNAAWRSRSSAPTVQERRPSLA